MFGRGCRHTVVEVTVILLAEANDNLEVVNFLNAQTSIRHPRFRYQKPRGDRLRRDGRSRQPLGMRLSNVVARHILGPSSLA
jgi:hypothetical protein